MKSSLRIENDIRDMKRFLLPADLLQLERHLRLVQFEVHRLIFHNLKLILRFQKCFHRNLITEILL